MLNPTLEDHTSGGLGYLNSLFNRLLCLRQELTRYYIILLYLILSYLLLYCILLRYVA